MADINVTQVNQAMSGLTREVQTLTASIRSLLTAQSSAQQQQNGQSKQAEKASTNLAEFSKQLRNGRKTTKEQDKLIQDAVRAKKAETIAVNKHKAALDDYNKVLLSNKKNSKAANAARAKMNSTRDEMNKSSENVKKSVNEVESSFKKLRNNIDVAGMALAWFGSVVSTQARQISTQNKANGGLVEGTGSLIAAMAAQQTEALKYKVDATAFSQITTGARQMFNAMGGTSAGLTVLDGSIDRFTIMMGSFEDGLRMATETAHDFAKKGVKPTTAVMENYHADLLAVRRQTGLSVEQAHQLYETVANDIDSIDMLRAARVGEREAILRSQRALIQQSIAAGMSAEQAKEAAKMLNKMVAAKPLDRLRQAAKVRAMAGAMGIAGGDQAAKAIIAGKRATPEQQLALQQFSQNATNRMDSMGRQDLGSEIFATTLMDKLNLDQYYAKGSPFSTTLGDSLKNTNGDLSKQYIDVTESSAAKIVAAGAGIIEQLKLIVTGQHWLGPIAAGVAAIAAIMLRGKITSALGKAGDWLDDGPDRKGGKGGKGGKPDKSGNQSKPGGAKPGSKVPKTGGLSRLAPALKAGGLIGAGVDVFSGISDLADGQAQTNVPEGLEKLSPMKWGMYLGDKINTGFESMTGGQTIGGTIYDWMNPSNAKTPNIAPAAPMVAPSPKSRIQENLNKSQEKATSTIADNTQTTADTVQQQAKKTDQTNTILRELVEVNKKQLDKAEKQLVASTMTEAEKGDEATRQTVRENRFNSQFKYV